MSTPAAALSARRIAGIRARLVPRGNLMTAALVLGLGILLAVVVVMPLLILLWFSLHRGSPTDAGSVLSLENYATTFLSPSTYALLGNTFVFTAGALAMGLAVGAGLAWLVERTNAPLRAFAFVVVILSGAIPSILFAMAWVIMLNARTGLLNQIITSLTGASQGPLAPFSLWSMAFVEGLRWVPTAFLMMVGLFHTMDPSLEEAAATSGSRGLTTFSRVTLPMMLPGLLGIAIYISVATIGLFEIPAALGMPGGIHVFATRIYIATSQVPQDYGLATTLGSVAGILGVLALFGYHRAVSVQQRFATVSGKAYRPKRIDLGAWRWGAAAAILVYFLVAVLVPVLILVWSSLLPFYRPPTPEAFQQISPDAYRRVLGSASFSTALRNTIVLILLVPVITMAVATLVAWVVTRTRGPGRAVLDVLTFLPFTVPSIVLGLAFLMMALYARVIPIYGTIWLIVLAHVALYLAYGSRTMNAAVLQLHRELEEAGHVSGLRWSSVFRGITLPLLVPTLSAGWLWVALFSGRELTVALMLSSPDTQPLSTRIWSVWQAGQTNEAAAMGVMLMAVVGAIALTVRIITRA